MFCVTEVNKVSTWAYLRDRAQYTANILKAYSSTMHTEHVM